MWTSSIWQLSSSNCARRESNAENLPTIRKSQSFVIWCSIPRCRYILLVRIITKGDRINKSVSTRKWEVLGGRLQVCLSRKNCSSQN